MMEKRSGYLEQFTKGQPIPAAQLNQLVNALRFILYAPTAPIGTAPGINLPMTLRQFKITAIDGDDYLSCDPYNSTESMDLPEKIKVAKPYLLRNLTERNGFTFTYSDPQTRVSTKTEDDTTENQVVVPSYVVGDIIYAAQNVIGNVAVTVEDADLVWLDMNVDGRAWSKAS